MLHIGALVYCWINYIYIVYLYNICYIVYLRSELHIIFGLPLGFEEDLKTFHEEPEDLFFF